jgi:hypothetical protein
MIKERCVLREEPAKELVVLVTHIRSRGGDGADRAIIPLGK